MATPTRDEIMIQLDRIDTALEAPEADRAAILREAEGWRGSTQFRDVDDASYVDERLKVIRERHRGD